GRHHRSRPRPHAHSTDHRRLGRCRPGRDHPHPAYRGRGMTSTAADARVRADAEQVGVCVRPLVQSLVDTTTGEETYVAIPCGSTRQRVCPSCAAKALRVREQQCREGWTPDTELPAVIGPRLVGLHVDAAAAKASEHVTLTAPHAGPRPIPTGDRTLNDPKVG